MKPYLRAIALCTLVAAGTARGDVIKTVDPAAAWQGYMNVFSLGGGYLWGEPYANVGALPATWSGSVVTLAPNSIPDPSDYWYSQPAGPGSTGQKIMDANFYEEVGGTLAGQTLTFTGTVLGNSLTSTHTAIAFIKDFAPDYSSNVATTVPLAPGEFSISQPIINDPTRHVQYGFSVYGVNVWITDVGPYGSVQVTAIPEPTTMLVGLGSASLLMLRRRQS